MLSKIKALKAEYRYKECREIIEKELAYDQDAELLKYLAECYYQDNELNKTYAFKRALDVLEKTWDVAQDDENKKEILNLKGAVYKRYFEAHRRFEDLKEAIKYYRKAWIEFRSYDKGYGGINTANLLDEMAFFIDDKEIKDYYTQKANEIREDIINAFHHGEFQDNWASHTLATAHFGLGEFTKAKEYIEKIHEDDEWKKFTTYKTFRRIAEVKDFQEVDVQETLEPFFQTKKLFKLTKTGLALSGGGFRASLFHLGTLSALAEAHRLKDIEVISTVSGGSIIGALYYLKIKHLLESKCDNEITQNDYLKLVDELIDEFLNIITNKNLRNEIFVNFSSFDEMVDFYTPFNHFSRTKKIATLYDKYFYSNYHVTYLKDLLISPKDERNFFPRFQNFKRENRVPVLIVNATNLNNGHNFQFHATKIGESEYLSEFDKNFKVSWLRQGCEIFDSFKISEAVAASSAVPGIFPALKVDFDEIEINLVDGGVFENIGLNALFSENCNEIIISDGGYEMDNLQKLSFGYSLKAYGLFKYLTRTVDVLMDVNKDFIYEKITQEKIINMLSDEREVFEISCKNPKFSKEPTFRELFSKIRTDLDRFNKNEANAIIYLGYIKMKKELEKKECRLEDYRFDFKDIEAIWESWELRQEIEDSGEFKFFR